MAVKPVCTVMFEPVSKLTALNVALLAKVLICVNKLLKVACNEDLSDVELSLLADFCATPCND